MPTLLRIGRWRFHFFSDEGQEPPHIHVDTGDGACKFWLAPVQMASEHRVPQFELRRIAREVLARQGWLLERWYEFFRQ